MARVGFGEEDRELQPERRFRMTQAGHAKVRLPVAGHGALTLSREMNLPCPAHRRHRRVFGDWDFDLGGSTELPLWGSFCVRFASVRT